MIVREEQASDRTGVEALVEAAFRDFAVSDHTEHLLVARLRSAPTFIPELSLVAEECNRIVGHVLLTPVVIADGVGRTTALGVAPLSVAPDRWRRGIGSRLMREAHARAAALGFDSAVLVGHPDYYPRFGYCPASAFGIRFPFEAPDECCLAVELLPEVCVEYTGQSNIRLPSSADEVGADAVLDLSRDRLHIACKAGCHPSDSTPPCIRSRLAEPAASGCGYSTTSSNWSLPTPQSGQTQSSGMSSKAVPGAMPPSGSPTSGS